MKGRRCLCWSMSDRNDIGGLTGPKYTHHLPAHLISTMRRQREQRCRRSRTAWRLWLNEETRGRIEGDEEACIVRDVIIYLIWANSVFPWTPISHWEKGKLLHGDGKWQFIIRREVLLSTYNRHSLSCVYKNYKNYQSFTFFGFWSMQLSKSRLLVII